MRIIGFLLVAILLVPYPAAARARTKPTPKPSVSSASPGESAALRSLIRAGRHSDLRWPAFSDMRPDLERLYTRTGWRPLWLEAGRPSAAALQLIDRLAGADSLGLVPSDYDAAWLDDAAAALAAGGGPNEQVRFDVALSVAAARFVDALEHGRVSPAAAGAQYPAVRGGSPLEAIVDSLRDSDEQGTVLERHQPDLLHYRYLKNALARYRALESDSSLARTLVLPRDLKPGMKFKDAARLRRRLQALGDLGKVKAPKAKADTLYSPELVEGIKRFQHRHGLDPDGVIWPNTAEELKRPFSENVRKIVLALERWRWLPLPFEAPPILVNLPAFRLYAFRDLPDRENNTLAMDVLIGAADRNATPVFAADMTYLVFRPYWEVPTDLMMDELGPRAAWDWELLERQGIVLVKRDSDGSKSLPLTPENLKRIGSDLRMRQLPGPHNVLGLVKFMFPNMHDVYLHDTQTGGLFALARRDFSHGCIRVSKPVELAQFVLRDQPDWDENSIKDAMQGEDNQRVNLPTPVPVYVTYATAGAFEDGRVEFYADIYGLDDRLEELLKKGYPYAKGPVVSARRSSGA
jgi:murein L,D-transpeptidase YcbB/YkuD